MTDASTILKLDKARREAMIRADVPALDGMFSDDLMWIHGNGRVDTKESLLDAIGSGKSNYLALSASDETVRLLGGLALISGVLTLKAEVGGGQVVEGQNRYTIVWAPDGDDWKVVNWQSTSIPAAS